MLRIKYLKYILQLTNMKYQKSLLLTLLALLVVFGMSAQQQSVKTTNTLKLSSAVDSLQYALGAFVGQWLVNNGFTIKNTAVFNKGMEDVLQNNPRLITDSTIAPIIASYQLSTQNEKNRQMEEQLFSALKGKPGVGVLPNGVHYLVVKQGAGIRPLVSDTVVVNAIGVFPDGTVFEDTYQKKQAITIATGSLIPGLSEAVQLMPEGSVWRIFVPSALAYGPAGLKGIIPANMAVVFDITLEDVKR